MAVLRRIGFGLLAAVLVAALVGTSAIAQRTTGSLRGVLTDDSGAVIPLAQVTLTGNGNARTTQTGPDGTYTFAGLPSGQYTIAVTFPGFAPYSKAVTVSTGSTVQVPVQLSITTEKQEVTVQADSGGPTVSVEPDNNATALVIKDEDLQALPDDPDDLADALQALAGPGAGPNGGQIYIDGFSGGQLPPKESIREIRINQNPFSAEFDRLGFGRIEILTKPGSDKYRGAIGLNDSNGVFNSRNPFATNKPDFSSRMFFGNFGGPINKKSSFFFDFNRRDIDDNAVTVATWFNPATLTQSKINTAVVTPLANTNFSPRVDYQLTTNNTLTLRMEQRWNSRENAGLGGTRLPPPYSNLAYNTSNGGQNVMATETAVLNAHVINETRFQFVRNVNSSAGNLDFPQINVAGSFVAGGNGVGAYHDESRHFELQNYTSVSHHTHTLRLGVRIRREGDQNYNPQGFNGTFTFLGGVVPQLDANNQIVMDDNGKQVTQNLTSIQQYARNVQLTAAGLSAEQVQALGGGPSRFTIQEGQKYISMVRWDAGPFIQDDWRIRPNITLSMGLRYEVQTLVSDHRDVAPRIGFAWAPGSAKNGRQKTVIRGGAGMFYDRIGFNIFEEQALNNGFSQLQYTVYDPTFYPIFPKDLPLSPGQNTIYKVDPKMRSPYSIQAALGVERQLPHSTTVAVTYTYNRSEHLMQDIPINTPFPGTFDPQVKLGPANGLFPYGYGAGNIFEYEPGGYMRQSIVMANFNTRFSPKVSLFGNYQTSFAKDLPNTPTDPYNFASDYGRSRFAIRNNFQLVGTVVGPKLIRLAPFVTMRTGQPYDVTTGQDLFGDTLTNARAAFAPPGTTCPGFNGTDVVRTNTAVCSPFGIFTSAYNVANPVNVVPRSYLMTPGMISLNLRIYRVFGFGPVRGNAMQPGAGDRSGRGGMGGPGGDRGGRGGARGGGGMRMGGGGMRGGGGENTEHRFNLTLGVSVSNILNHFNPGGYSGNITSPYFLQATSVNTGFGGGPGGPGGGSTANNRRIEFQSRLTF
jgi:hypothetical protein